MEELENKALLLNISFVLASIIVLGCIIYMYTRMFKQYRKANDLPSKIKYVFGIIIIPIILLLFIYIKYKHFLT